MDLTPTVNVIELIWVAGCAWVFLQAARAAHSTQLDFAAAVAQKAGERAIRIARDNRFSARARAWRDAYFVLIGLHALRLPDQPAAGSRLVNAAMGIGFISLAISDQVELRRERRSQKQLDREAIARHRREQAEEQIRNTLLGLPYGRRATDRHVPIDTEPPTTARPATEDTP